MDTITNENVNYLTKEIEPEDQSVQFYENKYELVTRVAFLCGVDDKFFDDDAPNFLPEVVEKLRRNDRVMLVRNLCLLRNAIEHNYKKINDAMVNGARQFFSLTEFYPKQALSFVESKGIRIPYGKPLVDIVVELNKAISDRINNCREIMPVWIQWDYIRDMFIMPDGQKKTGAQAAATLFYDNMSYYPYGTYINWKPYSAGNIFANDYKFAQTLYSWHDQVFLDVSNLSDVSNDIKNRIYEFINKSYKTILVVDCENADPYSLCAMFNCIDDAQANKIDKIILYDDPQASTGWRFFEQHVNIEPEKIEHIIIKRILNNKSLLDVKLSARIAKECYKNLVDSFIIVSSDSDFWGVMEELPQIHFLVMLEHKKASSELKKVLDENGIFYCYTDNFYTGMDQTLKKQAIFAELNGYFDEISFNVNDLFDEVLLRTRAEMKDGEKGQFKNKYIKTLQLHIAPDGTAKIEIKK